MDGEKMFQPNDYVIYGRSGVCVVEGTEQIGGQDFYCLRSLYQDCHIKTPVNGKSPIRPVISKDEANALIDRIPSMEKRRMNASNSRDLSEMYRASILSQECAELVELTMTIYAKKQEAQRTKKKLSSTDQAFLKEGEGLLFGELSVALGIPFDEVQAYIKNRLKSNKQNNC